MLDDQELPAKGLNRRKALLSLGGGTVAAAAVASGLKEAPAAAQSRLARPAEGAMPYRGVRVIEKSRLLTGRLAGQMFADQGAEVFIERGRPPSDLDDEYFDRGKTAVPPSALADTSSADVIIVDGDTPVKRLPHQVVMRVVAALPGDKAYGDLPADCDEGLISALVGFFTDMSITGPMLGRPVIYSPLPLSSVYAAVNGSIAVGAALVDRLRTGLGREVHASRIAGGLSAIGALTITDKGLPEHLRPIQIGGLPPGMTPEQFKEISSKAAKEARWQLWLEQRFAPLAAPYKTKDGAFVLPLAGPNRRLTRRFLETFGLYEKALAAGMVDVDPFDAANAQYSRNNIADSLALRFDLTSKLADWIEPLFAQRTGAEMEAFLVANEIPVARINSFEEWRRDRQSRESRLVSKVLGSDALQIGRMAWLDSAQPYPDLSVAKSANALPPRAAPVPVRTGARPNALPLAGFKVVDFANVIAGPSCGRMFSELGMDVIQTVPQAPNHSVSIVVAWSGELSGGKRNIILSPRTPEGEEIIRRLVSRTDIVLNNATDAQMVRLRIDPASLAALNPKAITVQLSAFRGEKLSPRHNDLGYDPSIQGATGIMHRFGPPGSPSYHGIASAVDYLCGYLAAWAGVTALYAREFRKDGKGDVAENSLAAAATLTQLLLQKSEPPESAVGVFATGLTPGQRIYQLSDGWIYVDGKADLSDELSGLTQAQGLALAKSKGYPATPVQTCRQAADRHRKQPTITAAFVARESDGWVNECWAPTWFAFDGKPLDRPKAAPRIGSTAPAILAELGYSKSDVDRMIASGVVGRTEFARG